MPAFKKRKIESHSGASTQKNKPTKDGVRQPKPIDKARAKHVQAKDPEPASEDEEDGAEDEQEEVDGEQGQASAAGEASKKTFADLGVREELCEACVNLKFTHPTPIQEQSIPLAIEGRDVIGLAETGSGKTAAFVLPILQSLMDRPQPLFGLVLAPTRELAYQISQQVEALGSIINVKCATLVGGMDMVAQAIALSKRPHIVVATPGRLLDHLENTKGFSLKHLKYLVMDEADRLLDLDFGPILDKVSWNVALDVQVQ